MAARKRKSGTDWPKADRRAISREEYDEAPEWTKEQLDRAEHAVGGKVVRPAQGTLTRPRGRPKVPSPKAVLSLRVDPNVLRRLKASGSDWRKRAAKAIARIAKGE